MKRHLSRFEALARRLIEGTFSRLFGEDLTRLGLPDKLAHVMRAQQQDGHAPDLYEIALHPDDWARVQQRYSDLETHLVAYVAELSEEMEWQLAADPQVRLVAKTAVSPLEAQVTARFSTPIEAPTALHDAGSVAAQVRAAVSDADAFLIIDGRRHVPLDRPLINIGRRMDNDVVLDSAAVSRRHAQLRWRYGRFVLYDLGGRGRTSVNGQPVTECVLQPGDVLALSDVLLIYGEGQEQRERPSGDTGELEETQLMPPRDSQEERP